MLCYSTLSRFNYIILLFVIFVWKCLFITIEKIPSIVFYPQKTTEDV